MMVQFCFLCTFYRMYQLKFIIGFFEMNFGFFYENSQETLTIAYVLQIKASQAKLFLLGLTKYSKRFHNPLEAHQEQAKQSNTKSK